MANVRVIHTEQDRNEIIAYIKAARVGTRVEVKAPARTSDQNARMWAMLGDIVRQRKTIDGRRFKPEQWKTIFMQALGHEPDVLPTLDGGFFAVDTSTSKLDTRQMGDLLDYISAWGAENNVVWSDPKLRSQEEMMR